MLDLRGDVYLPVKINVLGILKELNIVDENYVEMALKKA